MDKPDIKKMKVERDVDSLIEALKHKDYVVRRKAAEALGEIKDAKAVEPLIPALKDEDMSVRGAAIKTLGQIGDARAVKPLIEALRVDQSLVVGQLGLAGVTAALGANALSLNAVEALGKIGKPAVEPLIEALKAANKDIRYNAAELLGKIGDDKAVRPLIEAMKDKDWFVRGQAATALGEIGEPAVELLTQALGDEDKDIQKKAKEVLEKIQKKLKKYKK